MKKVITLSLCMMILWIVTIFFAHAEIRIEITQGINTAQPIAIVPFRWNGSTSNLPINIQQVIANDLQNSGKFYPIDSTSIDHSPTKASEISPNIFQKLGVNYVVVGQVQPVADCHYLISYQLVDVVNSLGTCTIILQNQFKVANKWLRYAAHTISDEIFAKITGIRGAFRTRIAYIVKTKSRHLAYELRISDYDGYNQFTVHRSSEPLMSPAWSTDGEKLAYVTFESGRSALVIQTLSTGERRNLTSFNCHNGAPTFSPDGTKIAFSLSITGSLHLYVMDLSSGKISKITEGRHNNTEPSWMPDSQTLLYTSDQTGCPQIYKIDINDGVPERITWEGNQNQAPIISHDGKFMVMVNSSNGNQHIAKQDLVTGNVKYLTNTFLDETPSIAPNSTMVIYSSTKQENGKGGLGSSAVLQLVSTDGRFKARLPATEEQVKFPAWSPYL